MKAKSFSDKNGNWELALILAALYILVTWLLPFGFALIGFVLIVIAIILMKEKTFSRILLLLSPILIVPLLAYLLAFIFFALRSPVFNSFFLLVLVGLIIGIVCAILLRDYFVSWIRPVDRWIGMVIMGAMVVISWVGAHIAQLCTNVSYFEKGVTEHEIAFCKFMHQYVAGRSGKFLGWPEALFFIAVLPVTVTFLILVANCFWKRRKHS